MKTFSMKLPVLVIIAVIGLVGAAVPVFAQKKAGLEVNPAYYDLSIDKSAVEQTATIHYTNYSKNSITLSLKVFNYQQKPDESKPIFNTSVDAPGSLIPYIRLEPSSLTLAPQESTVVKVTIENDQHLSPGGHYAAVVAEVVQDTSKDSQSPIVSPSVSTILLIRKIGGEKFAISMKTSDKDFPNVIFSAPEYRNLIFKNSGNTHLIPYGKIEEYDMFNRLIYKGIINTSSSIVFPNKVRVIQVAMMKVEKSLPISLNRVKIEGQDSLKVVAYTDTRKYLFINVWFFIMLAVLTGVLIIVKKAIRK